MLPVPFVEPVDAVVTDRLRIALVGLYYAPVIGGIETHMELLAQGLARQDFSVFVSCLARLLGGGSTRVGVERLNGISVRRVGSYGVGESLRWPQRLVPKGSADLIHVHGFSRTLLLRLIMEKADLPLVITPHGGVHGAYTDPSPLRRSAKLTFDRILAKRLLRTASRVIALTDVEAAHLRHIGVEASRLTVLPNAIGDEAMNLSSLRQGASGRLLVLSRLAPRKRIADVLQALLSLSNPPGCDIAGPDEGQMARLKELARRMPAQSIRFLGPVEGKVKVDLLRGAKALVLASSLEGLAITALEAIAQGTPVIASEAAAVGLPRLGILTFPVGDTAALASRIRSLEDPAVTEKLRNGASAARAEIKTSEDQLRHTLRVYEDARACV